MDGRKLLKLSLYGGRSGVFARGLNSIQSMKPLANNTEASDTRRNSLSFLSWIGQDEIGYSSSLDDSSDSEGWYSGSGVPSLSTVMYTGSLG